jgi:preprotein translocase subunit SecF
MELIRETNIDFMKYRKFWIWVSLVLVGVGVFAGFFHGRLNVGIDFSGGTQITVRFPQQPDIDQLREVVTSAGFGQAQIQRFGGADSKEAMIRTPAGVAGEEGTASKVLDALRARFGDQGFVVLSSENVGPQVGSELRTRGLFAVLWSMVGMLVYIWFRFELRFGFGAMMATLHDVLVTVGLYAMFGLEFNLTTIAAFLTLIGYSVNDTVVVFDRVRENMRKSPGKPLIELLNKSLNQTLSRTLLTGGTVLMACIALMIWGGEVLRGFAFVLFVGVIVGTYSSIYIASPFALLWQQMFEKRGEARPAAAASR